MKVEILEKVNQRNEELRIALENYDSKQFKLVIKQLEDLEKELKPWDDPYLLGYVYALLCNIYLMKDYYNEERIVHYSNKILLLSGQSLFEYTGNYSVFTQKNIKKLYIAYNNLIRNEKDYAFWGKARLLAFQKKYAEAELLLIRCLKMNNNNFYAYIMYGRLLEFQYKYDEAIKQFEKAIKIPSNTELSVTYQMLAYIYQKKADYKKAEELFFKAIDINKEDSRAPMRLSFLYYFIKDEQYEKYIDDALKISPDNSKVLTIKADFVVKKNFKEGIDWYEQAKIANPFCNMAIRNQALYNHNYSSWNRIYKNCIRQNRYDTLSYVYYVEKLYDHNRKNNKFCLLITNKILKRYCPFAGYEINYLNLYIKNHDFNFFFNVEKLISEDKYDIDLYFLIANAYKEKQDFENSKKYLQKASEINPFNSKVFYDLGYIEQQLRNYEKAINYYKKSLDLLYSTKTDVYLLLNIYDLGKYNKNINLTDIEKKINTILGKKKSISNWDYLILGEIAYKCNLINLSLSIFASINKDSFEHVLSLLILCSLYKGKNDYKKLNEITEEFLNKKGYLLFDSLADLIDMFSDEIDINVFKELFINNVDFQDNDFSKIIESEELRNNKDLRELWFWISTIRSLLCYKKYKTKESTISHYTGTDTLDALCLYTKNNSNPLEKYEENFKGKIRLSTITPANDPEEGNILSKILCKTIKGSIPTNKGAKKFAVLQTSLTLCEDSLTMLRFYGKKNFVEGSGVNIVFKNSYFVDTLTPSFSPDYKPKFSTSSDENTNIIDNKSGKNNIDKKCLYWILYYDSENNYLVFNPISKYKSQIIDLNKNVKKWNYIVPPPANASEPLLLHYYTVLGNNIKFALQEMKKTINKILGTVDNQEVIQRIDDLLFYIKYLFKDEAFSDEQELRLMSICSMGNTTMKDFHRKLYENYLPITEDGYNYVEKIIFGPNAVDCDITVEYYKHVAAISNKNIEIYKSHAPFSIVNNQGVECKK